MKLTVLAKKTLLPELYPLINFFKIDKRSILWFYYFKEGKGGTLLNNP
jgi:hypothetical protein